ncbi:MAG: hypothetical protein AAB797_00855 [Patescibacteria group bacterium]
MLKISFVLFMVGCVTGQTKPVSTATPVFAKANTTVTHVQQDIVKNGVIGIEIKRADMRLVYEEEFDQPTTVVRGACPRQSFLPDWRVMPRMEECLVWPIDEIGSISAFALQSDLTVTYIFADVVGEQASN